MDKTPAHPSQDELSAFGLGRLDEERALAIAGHLQGCGACCDRVENVPPDTLVKLLRRREFTALDPRAHGVRDAGPAETAAPDYAGGATRPDAELGSGVPLVATDIPPGLVDHPRYRLVRLLGKGGMGAVYLAEHIVMRQPRALKVISPEFVANPQAVERFHREIRTAARLDHPNIVRAFDAEQSGQTHFLVMEYVEGTDLADLLKKKGPLPIAHSCHFIRQAALGLEHARGHGMVHRDIKPHNLMLTRKSLVKILDFGLAKVVSEAATEAGGPTRDGAMMGTPDYMAPEQWEDARTADIRADIYSLGCTLYALLTGAPPFADAPGPLQKMTAHVQRKPRPLTEVRPEVPGELSALVDHMLAKSAADRPQTPAEVAKALGAFVPTGKPSAVAPIRKSEPVTEPAPIAESRVALASPAPLRNAQVGTAKRRRRLSRVWSLGIAVLLPVLIAGIVIMLKTPDGTLVLEVNEANPDVRIDGKTVAVKWDEGGKRAEITANPDGVVVTKDGFTAAGRQVTLTDGGRRVLHVELKKDGVDGAPGGSNAGRLARTVPTPGASGSRLTDGPRVMPADLSGLEVALRGKITCAKCDLKISTKCATVIKVTQAGKDIVYYFDRDANKKHHTEICQAGLEGTVTGTTAEDDGMHTVKVRTVDYAKARSVLDYRMKGIDGTEADLSQYKGKVVMIVNVASKCGLTPQYKGLEAAYEKYKGQGFVIIGVPANEFGHQEPGTDAEVLKFCTDWYHVTFPMLSKVVVKGEGIAPLYEHLTMKEKNPKFNGPLQWNFTKFLISRDAEVVARFEPQTKPEAPELVQAIETELSKK